MGIHETFAESFGHGLFQDGLSQQDQEDFDEIREKVPGFSTLNPHYAFFKGVIKSMAAPFHSCYWCVYGA